MGFSDTGRKPAQNVSFLPEGASLDELVPLLYDEVRAIAHRALRNEREGHTLSTTGLAHEAYIELSRISGITWKSRAHFMSVCARVIRNVLVDFAVARRAQKRGEGVVPLDLDAAAHMSADRPDAWVDLDEALTQLAQVDERAARVVECRFFAGMSVEETAEALQVSVATVNRDWLLARAWLNEALSD